MGYYQNHRRHYINENEVPESRHAIFIRGLPGSLSTEEVRDFFVANVGECSFDFEKLSADQSRLFVAVRFETREKAKEAMDKYRGGEIMGYRCELTWFRDIRRYAQYQQSLGGGGQRFPNRGGRGRYASYNSNRGGVDYDNRKRRHSGSRSRSRDRHSSSDRSRSGSRSASRSPSPRRSRNRSSSRDSHDSDASRRERKEDKKRDTTPDSEPERRPKKAKKHKKEKKRRTKRSPTPSSDSDGEIHSDSDSPKKEGNGRTHGEAPMELSSPTSHSPPPRSNQPIVFSTNIKNTVLPDPPVEEVDSPAAVISNTKLGFSLEEEDLPSRTMRPPSPQRQQPVPVQVVARPPSPLITKIVPTNEQHEKPPSPPPHETPQLRFAPVMKTEASTESLIMKMPPQPSPSLSSLFSPHTAGLTPQPKTSALINGLKTYHTQMITAIRAEEQQQEKAAGAPRLRRLVENNTAATRERQLDALDDERFSVVRAKARLLEKNYKEDFDTYVFVVNQLLTKDASLETKLRFSLKELAEDMEKKFLEELDVFIASI